MRVSDAYNNWSSTYDSDRNLTRDLDEQITRAELSHRGELREWWHEEDVNKPPRLVSFMFTKN